MSDLNDSTTAIVAHDAGAANHLISWLRSGYLSADTARLCFDGPAADAYKKIIPGFNSLCLNEVLDGASQLISGTGWASSLEHNGRILAKGKNIYTIAIIDHWTNYPDRFIRDNEELLPDEVWVVDVYAKELAEKFFPNIKIVIQRNDYIEIQRREIAACNRIVSSKTRILFLMEPILEPWAGNKVPGELQAFNFFTENMHCLNLGSSVEIVIRPHPSDPKGKYESCLEQFDYMGVKVVDNLSLAQMLAWSDIVIGCQTYAMVVALTIGKKVVSALPSYAPPCKLPHKGIIHLREYV